MTGRAQSGRCNNSVKTGRILSRIRRIDSPRCEDYGGFFRIGIRAISVKIQGLSVLFFLAEVGVVPQAAILAFRASGAGLAGLGALVRNGTSGSARDTPTKFSDLSELRSGGVIWSNISVLAGWIGV